MSLFQWILHVQLVSVLVFTATHVFAQDVHLTCPAVWANTQPVTLTCEVSKTSITNKCVTSTNTTVFNVNSGTKCTVSPAGYASCLSSSPQSPAINTCWCQENSTYYTFVYYFNADKAQNNGTWTCDKACRDGGGIANPLQITNGPGCVGVQVVDPPPPIPGPGPGPGPGPCGILCIILIIVILLLVFIILLVLCLVRKKGFVLVGQDDEQTQRIDHYVKELINNNNELQDIARKGSFFVSPAKFQVDGFRSLKKDGTPSGKQEQLHIKIFIRLFFVLCRSMETVKAEVKEFLLKRVTRHKVRIVPCEVNIPRTALDAIENEMQGPNNEDDDRTPKIYSAAPNRRDQSVIQIEGLSDEDVERAKNQVKKLIQTSGSNNGGASA